MRIHNSARVSLPHGSANEVQQNLLCFLENFKTRKLGTGFFWGLIFDPGIFWGGRGGGGV